MEYFVQAPLKSRFYVVFYFNLVRGHAREEMETERERAGEINNLPPGQTCVSRPCLQMPATKKGQNALWITTIACYLDRQCELLAPVICSTSASLYHKTLATSRGLRPFALGNAENSWNASKQSFGGGDPSKAVSKTARWICIVLS